MKHLTGIKEMSAAWAQDLFYKAAEFKQEIQLGSPQRRDLADTFTGLLFYENSTRTKASFKMAANRLGGKVMTIETAFSSVMKGETLMDTVMTLEAMGYHYLVIRSNLDNAAQIAASVAKESHIINAGDGVNEHPTQALLDAFTLQEKKPDFRKSTVLFVGDIAHSRVAKSNIALFKLLGVKKILACGPRPLIPSPLEGEGGVRGIEYIPKIEDALPHADAIYTLRIQFERHKKKLGLSEAGYRKTYGLSAERFKKLCKKDALVFHAGPMNVGLEIDREVADGARSCVLEQVANGVPIRMAVLAKLHESCK